MWDALFAIDSTLELVDMISIAMLLRIRWDLITADTNEAFTLLLRYPTPESPAYTFIKDALYLRDHLTPSGGAEIITRYGKKAPPIEQPPPPKAADIRAPSPSPSFVSSRTRHTIGSPKPFGSQQSGGGVGGLESLLQNAAKGVLDRGSQWSVGKAIRDAVGEVKKNVEAYQSGAATPSLSSGQTTPRSGGREFRKPARIATGGVVSHISGGGALSSNAIKKMESLERRNKQLARMLEGAVSELWEYHRERSEVAKEKKEEVEALSLAIAKVQFVQVYLEDSEIPLPMDENTAAEKDKEGEKVGTSGVTSPAGISTPKVRSPGPIARTASAPPPASPAAQSSKMAASSPGLLSPNSHLLTPNASTPRSPTSSSDLQHQQTSTRPRPHLASSSFSWMLGQDPDDAPRHTFAKASEHSSLASDEKRRMRGSISAGKGFLFGEEEEVGAEGGEGRRGSMAKKKGKGKGKKGEAVGEEVIGLDDVEVGLSGRKAEEEESAA